MDRLESRRAGWLLAASLRTACQIDHCCSVEGREVPGLRGPKRLAHIPAWTHLIPQNCGRKVVYGSMKPMICLKLSFVRSFSAGEDEDLRAPLRHTDRP
ncbi:hypothetical protein WOLCODRAFT_138080 [Wolfiporia cocos MD-104 SS10]|uniref:Uncharacterized protein n=1 Tax=Wolfiporia cocos (strain MD-104) TaxID=742152 RepID=A0A2H3JLS6_WOLCO|nr:hypothetical protein WOLCODRAFT_138080 [Wolfiporia cocos MD-104 SS10]